MSAKQKTFADIFGLLYIYTLINNSDLRNPTNKIQPLKKKKVFPNIGKINSFFFFMGTL